MLASMSGPLRPGASYESTGYADERIQHDHRPRPCHAGTRVRMPFIMSWLPAVPPSRARRTGRACVLWATHMIMFYAAVAQECTRARTGFAETPRTRALAVARHGGDAGLALAREAAGDLETFIPTNQWLRAVGTGP